MSHRARVRAPRRSRRSHLAAVGLVVAGLGAGGAGPALADAQTFAAQCGRCHARAQTLARRIEGDSVEAKRAALDAFLAGHHAADAALRERIVSYLVGLAGR